MMVVAVFSADDDDVDDLPALFDAQQVATFSFSFSFALQIDTRAVRYLTALWKKVSSSDCEYLCGSWAVGIVVSRLLQEKEKKKKLIKADLTDRGPGSELTAAYEMWTNWPIVLMMLTGDCRDDFRKKDGGN
ncbi:hypothetical protein TYRP_007016 [Tyrophagus putrescentiae]|nr:hypothetical protein TYRP_007016 [Tyrophagus putrescentiae]